MKPKQRDKATSGIRPQSGQLDNLRKQAEEKARADELHGDEKLSLEDARRLLHELRVHQIELDMQNEELRRTQVELDASRKKYLDLYDMAPVGYLTLSKDGLIIEANMTISRMLGIAKGDLAGKPLTSYILSEDQDIYYLHRKTLLNTGTSPFCELRMLHAGGSTFWANLVTVLAQTVDGEPVYLVMVSDISERKRMDGELNSSEVSFNAIFHSNPQSIAIARLEDGVLLEVNREWERITGFTREEAIGRRAIDLNIWADPGQREQLVAALREHRKGQGIDVKLRRKDGMLLDMLMTAEQIEFAGEECILTMAFEITDRRQSEKAIKASERRFRALVENLTEAIALIGPDGRFLYASPSASIINGAPAEEFMGQNAFNVIHPDDLQEVAKAFQGIQAAQNTKASAQFRLWRSDGLWRWIDAVATNRLEDPAIGAIVVNYKDITERKLAEEELQFKNTILSTQKEASIDGILVVDGNNKIISTNSRFAEMWGVPPDLIEKKDDEPVLRFVTGKVEDSRTFLRQVQHLYEHRQETSRDVIFLKDGRTFDRYSAPMFGPNGHYYGRVWYFRDVTEKVLSEKALRESEERYRSLINSMKEGMALHHMIYDDSGAAVDYMIDAINPAYEEITGLVSGKVLGQKASEFYGSGTAPFLGIYEKVVKTGEATQFETYFEPMRKHFRISAFSPGNGKFATVFEDITERIMVREELLQQKNLLSSIIESSSEAIFAKDSSGKYISINKAGARMLGYRAADVIGRTDMELLPDETANEFWETDNYVMSKRKSYKREETGVIGGKLRVFLAHKTPWRDNAGKIIGIIGVSNDITEQKLGEEKLLESEKRYRELFNNISSGVAVYIAKNNGADFTFVDVNPAGERFSKISKDQVQGQSILKLFPAVKDMGLFHALQKAWKTGIPQHVSKTLYKDERISQWVENHIYKLPSGEIVAVFDDITGRKRDEERIRMFSGELLAAREEERKRVASALHHDTGSLAVGMSAWFDAIEEDIHTGKPTKTLKSLKSARKLFEQSVTDLKRVAVELRPPDLDLLGLKAAMRQHFSRITERSGVQINFREALGRRRLSSTIATVLFRISQEALTNAVRHGRAKRVEISLRASKKSVTLTIGDNGKGFDQSKQSVRQKAQLGLRVMEEMAVSSAGILKIDSAPGKGTTVRAILPLDCD